MPVALQPVTFAEKPQLRAMFDPYLIAHARLVDPDGATGDPTDYRHFDAYWTEPERRPYWIMADGVRAGFVLINTHSPSGLGTDHSVAEFSVVPERRRGGLGRAAARAALATAAGWWELQVYRANPDGMAFWPRAIGDAHPSTWDEIDLGDRVVHRFRLP